MSGPGRPVEGRIRTPPATNPPAKEEDLEKLEQEQQEEGR